MKFIAPEQLQNFGIAEDVAEDLSNKINYCMTQNSPEESWQNLTKTLLNPKMPFELHLFLFKFLYPNWPKQLDTGCAWIPELNSELGKNLREAMSKFKFNKVKDFHEWSHQHYSKFWEYITNKLGIVFNKLPDKICDISQGIEKPSWFPNAKLNIADSCFIAPENKVCIIFKSKKGLIEQRTYRQLHQLSNQIANSLEKLGFKAGDKIAINMPMTYEAVGIYLGIIKLGGIVISIADSFSSSEIATRLKLADAKAIFTQDVILRNDKRIPLYQKVIDADAPQAIVLPCDVVVDIPLRDSDVDWNTFLLTNTHYQSIKLSPMSFCNILFSSGTTGLPKAIPWNHTTGIKAASDAYLHHDIQKNDILAWPTNLGWMMGPWLIFAGLINQATIALYNDIPTTRAFGHFIQDAKVTILGVVPTLIASWRHTNCMEGLNWTAIKTFTSTGECSSPEDMLYLMSLAHYKPIIEYCGGTEIGGAYISSTLLQNNYPCLFTTPTFGLDFTLLDQNGYLTDLGEIAIIPPSIGLSTELLYANHHDTYYAHMPLTIKGQPLRRHGDQVQYFKNHTFAILGRADDTMNLGGIKISATEIERVLSGIDKIIETAAIAVCPSNQGPSKLIIYAATHAQLDKITIQNKMQQKINDQLNPLFKITDLILTTELPKTPSNKIMRRILRENYMAK